MTNLLNHIAHEVKPLNPGRSRAEAALKLIKSEKDKSYNYHIEHFAQQGVKKLISEYEKRLFYKYSISLLKNYMMTGNFDLEFISIEKSEKDIIKIAKSRLQDIVTK